MISILRTAKPSTTAPFVQGSEHISALTVPPTVKIAEVETDHQPITGRNRAERRRKAAKARGR